MRNLVFFTLAVSTLWFFGCGQSNKWSDPAETHPPAETENTAEYNQHLLLMNDSQRAHFFELNTDTERQNFIQAEGIQQKKELNEHLKPGMPPHKVRALLGNPLQDETYLDLQGKKTQWIYSSFNGYRNVKFAIDFHNGKLEQWRLWLP